MSGQAAAWEGAGLHEQLGSGCLAHPEPWLPKSSQRFLDVELIREDQTTYASFGHPNMNHRPSNKLRQRWPGW